MIRIREWKKNDKQGFEVDIRVWLPTGVQLRQRKKSPVEGKSNTVRWAQEREAYLIRKGGSTLRATGGRREVPTLSNFAPRFLAEYAEAERQKPSSIDSKRVILKRHLEPRFGAKRLDQIDQEDIQKLKAALKDLSPKTVNNVLSTLGKMLRVAVEWGLIDEMPCRVKLLRYQPPTMSFYDWGEYERLVRAADNLDARIKAIVLLGGDAGLRRGEIIGLDWADIDFRRRVIHVQRSVWRGQVTLPKGGRSRRVPMTLGLREALSGLERATKPRAIHSDLDTDLTKEVLTDWMSTAQRAAELRANGGMHILRHTFCSHLAMRGAPARAIQELAGHANLSTTMRYMHLSPGATDAAIQLLDSRPSEEVQGDIVETEELASKDRSEFKHLLGGETGIRTLDRAFDPILA